MVSDLTERLRNRSLALKSVSRQTATTKYDAELSDEAADEIERLTAALAEARDKALEEAAAKLDAEAEECLDWLIGSVLQDAATTTRALKEKP